MISQLTNIILLIPGAIGIITGTISLTIFVFEFFAYFGSGFFLIFQRHDVWVPFTVAGQYGRFPITIEYWWLMPTSVGALIVFFFLESIAAKLRQ